ncbi:MAG: thymidylate synthase [Clostridia bacterium]|nr:thymidylate synthase [Clostridia bacterium]
MGSADVAFIETCKNILENGSWVRDEKVRPKWPDGTPAYTKKLFCVVNRYDLSKEFPLITLRPISLKLAVDEILWIYQKKSNNIHDLGSHIWDSWADENGSIGKAYGYQAGVKHHYREGDFDMIDKVLYDLKNTPYSRRIMTNLYNFADLSEMALYPCAYSMTFNVTDGKLCAILNQRSQDMLAANGWNVAQYAALVMMIAQATGFEPGEFVHVIADCHIYDRHIPIIEELIKRPVYDSPKVTLDPSINDFYGFTPDSFTVENYVHGDKIPKFEVAV